MNMLSPLPKILPAELGESSVGLLLRTANANHLEGLRWFYTMLGRTSGTQLHKDDIPEIASVTGQRIDTIEAGLVVTTMSNGRLKYVIGTHSFSKAYGFRSRAPQLCPLCLTASGFTKLLWELTFVNACTVHNCALVDSCPQCGKPIRWSRLYLVSCNCGMAWKAIPAMMLDITHPSSVVSEIVLNQVNGFQGNQRLSNNALEEMLGQISLDMLFQLLWIFGSKGAASSHSAKGQRKTIPRTGEAIRMVEQAFERMQVCLTSGVAKRNSFEKLVHVPSLLSIAKHISDPHDAHWLCMLLRGLGRDTTFRTRLRIPGVEQLCLF